MNPWLTQHLIAVRETLARLVSSPFASALSVLVIGVSLSLPVFFYVVLSHLQVFSRQISSDPQISIFMAVDASKAEVQATEQRLLDHDAVHDMRYIPREEALTKLQAATGWTDLSDNLQDNPLPDAFVATVKNNAPEALERLREEAGSWPKVAHVQLDSEWARRLDASLRLGRTAIWILAGLLAGALMAVTFNTIRLQILTRREEIEVSKLIGATDGFIRRPFLYFGALQGLAGGLTAWLLVALCITLLNRDLQTLVGLYSINFHLQGLRVQNSLGLFAVAGGLGWLGAWLSVARHLARITPSD